MSIPRISRKEEMIALRDQYSDLIGLPWTGRRIYGCYEIIRKYYKFMHDDDLPDFNARGIITFTDEALKKVVQRNYGRVNGERRLTSLH